MEPSRTPPPTGSQNQSQLPPIHHLSRAIKTMQRLTADDSHKNNTKINCWWFSFSQKHWFFHDHCLTSTNYVDLIVVMATGLKSNINRHFEATLDQHTSQNLDIVLNLQNWEQLRGTRESGLNLLVKIMPLPCCWQLLFNWYFKSCFKCLSWFMEMILR